nr:hypothetical protein [Tanacetum cinerariifolium]
MRCGSGLSKGLCLICGNNQNSLNDSPSISENSSQSPPHINHHCCYECGDPLDDESPFTCDSTPNIVNDSPNVFNPPPQPPKYSYVLCGNDAYDGYDCPPQVPFTYDPKSYSICYDDDEDYTIAITPKEPDNYLNMGDEHLDTILATGSDEFIKSSVENLVSNPSESKGEQECDVPACDDFTTFFNLLFDAEDDFSSSDDESFSDEDISKKIYSNPLFDEEIISMKIDPKTRGGGGFGLGGKVRKGREVEDGYGEDSLIISSSSKIDYLLDEFTSELIFLKSILPGIDKADYDPEEEIHLVEILLYDNSSPRIDNDYSDSEGDNLCLERLLHDDPIPLSDILDFSNVLQVFLPFFTYPVTSSILLSPECKDTNFDPGISNYHFSSLELGVSHWSGTFMKFNVYLNHLNESLMEILSSTCFPMD